MAKAQPRQVVLRFDEAVEGNFGAIRVFDARGDRVDDGRVTHPDGAGAVLAVGLKPGLAQGTFTATYRVVSADSHPVSGGFVFSIGRAGAAPAETVGDLLAGSSPGRVTQVAFGIARGADYLAIALVLGTLLFGLLCWRGGTAVPPAAAAAFARRSRALLLGGVALGVLASAAGLVLQAATAGGTSFWAALDPDTLREVLGTRFGTVWGLRILDLLLLGGLVAVAAPLWLVALPAAFLALTPALGGHATTQHPVALLAPLDVVHVVAMSAWVGGLVALVVAVPAATRAVADPAARTPVLAGPLTRFSALALASVGLLVASGTAQSIVHLRSFGDLLHTAFGRAVLIKIVLLLLLVGLGALNRRRSVPRIRAAAAAGTSRGGGGPRPARDAAGRGHARRRGARGHRGAGLLRAAVGAVGGPLSHTARTGPLESPAHRRPGAGRGQRGALVRLPGGRRRSVHADQGAAARRRAAEQGDRPAARRGPPRGARPLRHRRADADARRHLADHGDRPRLGLRRVHRALRGAGAMSFLLALAPLALLVGTLLLGRYPGERTLAAHLRGARPRRRRRAAAAPRGPRRPFAAAPRGGRLVAAAIASRPPPLA